MKTTICALVASTGVLGLSGCKDENAALKRAISENEEVVNQYMHSIDLLKVGKTEEAEKYLSQSLLSRTGKYAQMKMYVNEATISDEKKEALANRLDKNTPEIRVYANPTLYE